MKKCIPEDPEIGRPVASSFSPSLSGVVIYVDKDQYNQHHWGGGESYRLAKIVVDSRANPIHPSYKFLHERPAFMQPGVRGCRP